LLAVDMPRMTPAFLQSVLESCPDSSRGLVCRTTDGFEPLCAVYPPDALPWFQEFLQQKNGRMQSLVEQLVAAGLLRVRDLKPEEVPLFFNANTPEEYTWTTSAPPASN
jgi:molybdopterin-guanine dinucleotide biosynthesis protein A